MDSAQGGWTSVTGRGLMSRSANDADSTIVTETGSNRCPAFSLARNGLKSSWNKSIRQEQRESSLKAIPAHVVQIKILREDLDLKRKQEIHEIEERKNVHINELMKKHEKAFAEIKNYYIDITHNNLDLIKTLKVRNTASLPF